MKEVLAWPNRAILEQFAWSNVLLAFDFDGTLAPIVANRDRAAMRSKTRELLEALSALYPIVVISGRARADVLARLEGSGVRDVVGNHGIEPWKATRQVLEEVRRWHTLLHERLDPLRGVALEDKGFSVAVHFRKSREKKRTRAAILAAAAMLGDVRVIGGKQVVNILPANAPHKGLALERERERLGCDTAVYVGDDDTDEDVFAMEQSGRLLAIRVGAKRSSQAAYFLKSQLVLDELLRRLIALRRGAKRSRIARP